MSNQDDDQEDSNVFDQLKSIKAFTVEQLYVLHPDVSCPEARSDCYEINQDQNLYQLLVEYEQLRNTLLDEKSQIKQLHQRTLDCVNNVWVFSQETSRKIGMCQQGKIAETTFNYKQAFIKKKYLRQFDLGFTELSEKINKDYIHYSYESQSKRHKITAQLSVAYHTPEIRLRANLLKSCITTLVDFIKHLGDGKSDFVLRCRGWLRALIRRYLEVGSTDDYRFVLSRICKGPPGVADYTSDLIDQVSDIETTPQYITHCSALLSEIFSNPQLSENDVIKFCLKIPINRIFMSYVRDCLKNDNKNYEYVMLKLLTIGTIIIKTYQKGLESFNSAQYVNLIEYLGSQIRRTVVILSNQWAEFKRCLRGTDKVLMMRLQVEYDNFILRSILIILELRQSGIWSTEPEVTNETDNVQNWSTDSFRPAFVKLLQVTGLIPSALSSNQAVELGTELNGKTISEFSSLTYEFPVEWFEEVSEPMLWHILWQFHHSAFVSSCDYHSNNYWLEKFQDASVIYLFVNKMKDSSASECNHLLNSMTSMLLSRSRHDSELVGFISTEIFNLTFKHESLKAKVNESGVKSLIRCAEKFPSLISLYISFMVNEELDDTIVDLIKGCSLFGWMCDTDQVDIIASWLIEYPLSSVHNKVARLIMSKLLINSPELRPSNSSNQNDGSKLEKHRFLELKMRRRFTVILYEASNSQLPASNDFGQQSLGTFVEVALGSVFGVKNSFHESLIELATENNYQHFYIWVWKLLICYKLHILDQPETDWNSIQSRSNTSRSVRNTVLLEDSFHQVPTIQDPECLSIAEGLKKQNPIALFIYLVMTDVTWQTNESETCLKHLNVITLSGHLTPSLIAMNYFTICHIDDANDITLSGACSDYFVNIITSSLDATIFASMIMSQLQRLRQYRQLQLSQFYINFLLQTTSVILKRQFSSWFSKDEYNLEKIASILDYIIKFNFSTQRLEIIRKFYESSYYIQKFTAPSGWLGSILTTSTLNANSTKKEFQTALHVLSEKFEKYTWLRWITTECDTLRLEKIWEDIVAFLSSNEGADLDFAIKKVCPQMNPAVLKSVLPIYSWIAQILAIVESDLSHPLCPLIWYNFFLNYFANSLNGPSVGLILVPQDTLTKLTSRLDSLINYHLYKQKNWSSPSKMTNQTSLPSLYRAYRLWLQDASLQDAYVETGRLSDDYLVPLLKTVMESSVENACVQYIDYDSIEIQNRNLSQIWLSAIRLSEDRFTKEMVVVEGLEDSTITTTKNTSDEASDATSLLDKQPTNPRDSHTKRVFAELEEELKSPKYSSNDSSFHLEEVVELIKQKFTTVFEESSVYNSNLSELERTKMEMIDLLSTLYSNKKAEYVRFVTCNDGSECAGPARIKFEVEEASIDDRKSECIRDRQRQCENLVSELLMMPSGRIVHSTITIEEHLRRQIRDPSRAKQMIESILRWISEPSIYNELNGSFYVANHLLKTTLEILSTTDEIDTYNSTMIEVCLQHPGSVDIFSPYLTSPSKCSVDCFLNLYKMIGANRTKLGPTAMFVLLTKFDINLWLKSANKTEHHDIIETTCSALGAIGKQPDESFDLTFHLYKRHIQIELAPPDRRKPQEIILVLRKFLDIMKEQNLAPNLWVDFMAILGLEKRLARNNKANKSQNLNSSRSSQNISINEFVLVSTNGDFDYDESSIAGVVDEIIRLSENQKVLDYQALDCIMKILCEFVTNECSNAKITVLETYHDYLNQFGIVMLSITLMWIKAVGECYPNDHEFIWTQFMGLWGHWVYIDGNCQNVSKFEYSLVANLFVAALGYLLHKLPDSTQQILHSVLTDLTNYVKNTREVVYLELTILQRCLKNLPWSKMTLTAVDFEYLAALSEQENYNISDLVSHILLQINLRESLTSIKKSDPTILPTVAEYLATTVVLQSAQLKALRLNGCYFTLIPVDRIDNILFLVLTRLEYANLEHSQNNKLLVNLLRNICIKLDSGSSEELQELSDESKLLDMIARSNKYARFVSNYLLNLIKDHPSVTKNHPTYISAVIDNSLSDLKVLSAPQVDISLKVSIYENLLGCCSGNLIDYESAILIADSFINSNMLKNRPIAVMEAFHATGQILSNGRVLVHFIERFIDLYLSMNGHYEKVWKSFALKVLPSDLYLGACIEENAAFALLVYFEALYNNGQDQNGHDVHDNTSNKSSTVFDINVIWSSFFHWIAQLTVDSEGYSEAKLVVAWLRLLDIMEPNLNHFIHDPSGRQTSSASSQDGEDANKSKKQRPAIPITTSHQSLVNYIRRLIAIYDSYNSGSLWSYIKMTRTEQTSRASLMALAVASFMADRCLTCINQRDQTEDEQSHALLALNNEMLQIRKVCLSKLESAVKSKNWIDHVHFIETLAGSINQSDKVQYCEGVRLITTYMRTIYPDECDCLMKILPSFKD